MDDDLIKTVLKWWKQPVPSFPLLTLIINHSQLRISIYHSRKVLVGWSYKKKPEWWKFTWINRIDEIEIEMYANWKTDKLDWHFISNCCTDNQLCCLTVSCVPFIIHDLPNWYRLQQAIFVTSTLTKKKTNTPPQWTVWLKYLI